MDPLTIAALIQAAPVVLGALSGGPKAPSAPNYSGVGLPDRSKYQNMILDSAFNPQNELYRTATERMMADLNSQWTNRGLGISSAYDANARANMAELANKFVENELARRNQAFNTVTGYDIANSQLQAGQMRDTYGAQMQNYQNELARNQQLYSGMSNLGQIYAGYAGRQDQNARMDRQDQIAQERFDRMMNAQSGGQYSYSPTSYSPVPRAPAFQGGMRPYVGPGGL